MVKIAPSILSADFFRLGEQIRILEKEKIDFLHIDVMDGSFVPNISFGLPVIASIRKYTGMFFDVHLMIDEPVRYVKEFAEAGADLITVHYEAASDIMHTINVIRSCGKKCGVSIKPGTPVSVLEPLSALVDLVLVMSVEPGFGGQSLNPGVYDRVGQVRKMLTMAGSEALIEVDGGVTYENAAALKEAGVDVLVTGSAVFKEPVEDSVRTFKKILGL